MNSTQVFVLLAAAVGRSRSSAFFRCILYSKDTPEEALENFAMKMEISSYESGLLST